MLVLRKSLLGLSATGFVSGDHDLLLLSLLQLLILQLFHGPPILVDKTNCGLVLYNHANFYRFQETSSYWSVKPISVFSTFRWLVSDYSLCEQLQQPVYARKILSKSDSDPDPI